MIERELEFPGALVTVTEVEVTKKLDAAHVRVSVIPSERGEGAVNELQNARGRLQHLLNKKIRIKPMPQILFEIDRGPEEAAKVEKIFIEDNNKQT